MLRTYRPRAAVGDDPLDAGLRRHHVADLRLGDRRALVTVDMRVAHVRNGVKPCGMG